MVKSLMILLCFVFITYSWAKYLKSSEYFEYPKRKYDPYWYIPRPTEAYKGKPFGFTGKEDGVCYAKYKPGFVTPRGHTYQEEYFAFQVTFSSMMNRGVIYLNQLDGMGLLFVALYQGRLRLTLSHRFVTKSHFISGRVNDLKPHTFKVYRIPGEKKVNVHVDNLPSKTYNLPLRDSFISGINVYLGGIPIRLKRYNNIFEPSFIGCIYSGKTLINSIFTPISIYNFVTHVGDIKPFCEPPTFIRLFAQGYAETPFPGEKQNNFNVSIKFQTLSPNSLLLMDLSSKSMYFAMYLKGGDLWIAINDGNFTTQKILDSRLSNWRWHTVSVQESGNYSLIWVYVDGHRYDVKFESRAPFVNGSSIILGSIPNKEPYNQIREEEKALYAPFDGDILDIKCNGYELNVTDFKIYT